MSENQPVWMDWAHILQHWGINKGVASLLELSGSLSVLFAQVVYISQPLLSGVVNSASLYALAGTLENPADRKELIAVLREGIAREPAA